MKLYLNRTSPFARLVRAALAEAGHDPRLIWVDPWTDPQELLAVNPLARVPALVLDDGTALTETLVILHRVCGADRLQPAAASELGTAYGVMELAFAATIHRKFCDAAGPALQDRRQASLQRGLHGFAQHLAGGEWNLARMCLWIALDYIRFRQVTDLAVYPALQTFMAEHRDRPALQQTAFA